MSNLIANVSAVTSQRLLIVGDLNCPGSDSKHIDDGFVSVFDLNNLVQLVPGATRGTNHLDS